MDDAQWKFVGWAGPAKEPYRHWACYPDKPTDGTLKDLWNLINDCLQEEGILVRPERAILNLFNHGDSSWIHQDSEDPTDITIIVFMNEHWDPNWGGDFALFDETGEIIISYVSTPGKFIAFPSIMRHAARPVSRECPTPRFGIAFQCKHDSNVQKLQKPTISSVSAPL